MFILITLKRKKQKKKESEWVSEWMSWMKIMNHNFILFFSTLSVYIYILINIIYKN